MSTNAQTLRYYWQHIKKYKVSFITSLVGIPIAALFTNTFLPYFLSEAIGTFAAPDSSALWTAIWLAGGVAFAGVLLNYIGFQTLIHHESAVRRDLTNDVVGRLLMKDQTFFSNQKIGALTGKLIDFVNAHVGLQDLFIIRTLSFLLGVGSGIVIIFLHTPVLGGIILALVIGLLIQVRISMKIRAPYRTARKKLIGEVNGAAADSITNALTVKTFAGEMTEKRTLGVLTEKYRSVYQKDFRFMSAEGSIRILVMAIVQIIAIVIIASLLTSGQLELSIAIFTIAYLQRVASQLFDLGDIINGYDRLFIQAAPMTEILMTEDRITDAPRAKKLRVAGGAIAFRAVTYAYEDAPDVPVLDNFSLTIPKGQKVGLVGASGAGKTTLTKLLLRFDDNQSGEITIDDQAIDKVTQVSLRENIAYVPQEPALFHRTLRENISYGSTHVTEEQLRRAAKQAHALDFIEALPHGFDTIVGERGVKLSGGQRQRIAVARALLKNAPILILDEATSALDSESERYIQDSLKELMKKRTSIVIAHRLSTIAQLDRIIVLKDGAIIEDGTHAELNARNGVYATLWKHQSGGFIEE
jgi:ATP-binding cassette subfamily B protein